MMRSEAKVPAGCRLGITGTAARFGFGDRLRQLGALALVLLIAGCDGSGLFGLFGTKSPYPLTTSRLVYAPRWEGATMYWLDNERVLVPGYAPLTDPPAPPGTKGSFGPVGLYIWDTRANTYARHADLGEHYSLCYNEGFITYTTADENGDKRHQSEGQFGSEQPLPVDTRPSYDFQPAYSRCPRIDPAKRLRLEHVGRNVPAWFLKEEHGYLSTGNPRERGSGLRRATQDDPVKLFSPRTSESILLPILAKELRTSAKMMYSPYAERYIIIPDTWRTRDVENSVETWPRNVAMPVYLLSIDGKLDVIEVPYGTWVPPHMAVPTKQGLFIASSNAPSTNSKQAGGWLLKDGRMIKLFDHLVSAAGVSPDGCKIAYANNDFTPETTEYTSVIDLCK